MYVYLSVTNPTYTDCKIFGLSGPLIETIPVAEENHLHLLMLLNM